MDSMLDTDERVSGVGKDATVDANSVLSLAVRQLAALLSVLKT